MRRFGAVTLVSCVAVLAAASGAVARTWHVPGDTPFIQIAVDSASSGDDVLLAAGVYSWTSQAATFPGMVRLKAGIHLHSEGGREATILDGEGIGRLLYCSDIGNEAVIDGITFRNGFALPQIQPKPIDRIENHENRFGGAIWALGNSTLTVRSCAFEGNQNVSGQSAVGGAVFCSAATFTDCHFSGNSARGSGGGGGAVAGGAMRFERCKFVNNVAIGDGASSGGAVSMSGGVVLECTFEGNRASAFRSADGGAIVGSSNTIALSSFQANRVTTSDGVCAGGGVSMRGGSIDRCVFVGNSAVGSFFGTAFGGAVRGYGTPQIQECVFLGNIAKRASPERGANGGALALESGVVENCTLIGNSGNADDGIGGISVSGPTTIRTSIVAGTVGLVCNGPSTWTCCDLYGNAGADAICGTDGGHNFSLDPLFCAKDPVAAADVTLQAKSPCAEGASPGGTNCGRIGAGLPTCGPVPVTRKTWSSIKRAYR